MPLFICQSPKKNHSPDSFASEAFRLLLLHLPFFFSGVAKFGGGGRKSNRKLNFDFDQGHKERRGDGGDDWGVFFLANEKDYSSVVLVDKGGDDGGDG